MGDKLILNGGRLPAYYDLNERLVNPFLERFGKFSDIGEELIDIFDNNLTFAAHNLLKWKGSPMDLAPFQSVILETLWHKTFPVFLASRGAGKSWLLAVYCALRAMLCPGSKIVIVAASFRQSKIVFDYLKKIYDESPIMRQCVSMIKTPNDQCIMEFGGGVSSVIALPLGNGERIRGIRASDILCDEYASIPEEIFQVVVRGFAAVSTDPVKAAKQIQMEDDLIKRGKMKASDRKRIRGNKIIYSGTAYYQFNHFWKLYSMHKAIIDSKFIGDARDLNKTFGEAVGEEQGHIDYRDYAIVQLPYTGLPKGFMDDKQIAQAMATMPKAMFQMEYECQFPTDSDGFFKRTAIKDATPGEVDGGESFSVELVGDASYEYVMGIDPARKTDNFAISIVKLMPDGSMRNVYCWTANNKNFVSCTRKIRELLTKFNIVRIAMDSGGGGTSVEDLLQNVELLQPGEKPIFRYNDKEQRRYDGIHILDMVNFTPSWIADANYGLAADIEHKRIFFPYLSTSSFAHNVDEDAVWDEIAEQINEMCMIVVSATKTGIQHFDLPETPSAANIKTVQRKDRYSALLLASYAGRSYKSESQHEIEPFIGDWIDFI